jgi:hypothetical protein
MWHLCHRFLGGRLSRHNVSVVHGRYACALNYIVMTSTTRVYRTLKMGEYSSGFDEIGQLEKLFDKVLRTTTTAAGFNKPPVMLLTKLLTIQIAFPKDANAMQDFDYLTTMTRLKQNRGQRSFQLHASPSDSSSAVFS